MKLCLFGSRGIRLGYSIVDTALVNAAIDDVRFRNADITQVVSGGCPSSPDIDGEEWADRNNVKLVAMPAKWAALGKAAGFRRNEDMAKLATAGIGIWDGKSAGTKHMASLFHKAGKPVYVMTVHCYHMITPAIQSLLWTDDEGIIVSTGSWRHKIGTPLYRLVTEAKPESITECEIKPVYGKAR